MSADRIWPGASLARPCTRWARIRRASRRSAVPEAHGRADDAPSREEGAQQAADEAMYVEQGHDVQTAVSRAELVHCADIRYRGAQVGLGQGHDLRARCRTRRVQDEGHVVRRDRRDEGALGRITDEREPTGAPLGQRPDPRDGNPTAGRLVDRRRIAVLQDDKPLDPQIFQLERELAGRVVRVREAPRSRPPPPRETPSPSPARSAARWRLGHRSVPRSRSDTQPCRSGSAGRRR